MNPAVRAAPTWSRGGLRAGRLPRGSVLTPQGQTQRVKYDPGQVRAKETDAGRGGVALDSGLVKAYGLTLATSSLW